MPDYALTKNSEHKPHFYYKIKSSTQVKAKLTLSFKKKTPNQVGGYTISMQS